MNDHDDLDVIGCEHCWNVTTFYERVVTSYVGRWVVTYCGECVEEVGRKEEA